MQGLTAEQDNQNSVFLPQLQSAVLSGLVILLALLACPLTSEGVSFRWSESSYRIYVEDPGTATFSDIKTALPKAPLTQIAPGVWYLAADLQVANGARLEIHGTKIGGDCNELRLRSNNEFVFHTNSDSGAVIEINISFISVDWGFLDIRNTKIISWDEAAKGPDLEYSKYHRAYIRCRSSMDPDGVTAHESRMDIMDSEIGYLGSHDAEAYGLVWKVATPKINPTYGTLTNLYNMLNVYGDIIRTRVHNNFFGMYSFGSYGQIMVDNEFDHNVGYGFDPHDDSDFLVIARNNVHHNGWHGIIASQRCNNLIIRDNTSWENGRNGIMLHRYCDDSLVENNKCLNNGDSGVALFDTQRATVINNKCFGNYNAGIRLSVGASYNLIVSNEFANGASFGLYCYKGIDAPKPGDDGHPRGNRFLNNVVHDNGGNGIFVTTGDQNVFSGNLFYNNNPVFWFVNGQGNRMDSNSIPRDAIVRSQGAPSVPTTTFIRNQPYAPVQVDAYSTTTFEDNTGKVYDPDDAGLFTTVTPSGTSLTLTAADILKDSHVYTRNLQATPDAGFALINILIWNTSGDLSKRWKVQAGSSTHAITFRIGDLDPNRIYVVSKNGVSSQFTASETGFITYQDKSVTTGLTEYILTPL
jgi:mannuronan 5-epimerase